jgi:hypothetical protein
MKDRTLTLLVAACTLALPACGDVEDDGESARFAFADADFADYARVDRMAMPAVGTAVIMDKEAYNQADPADDAAGDFVDQITTSVEGLHMALDDDLTDAGLVPCAPQSCVDDQAGALVVPDTLKIDTTEPSGFPNGRRFEDPVIDVTLAVLLLDLSVDDQDATKLAGLPLNPPENDLGFDGSFPYIPAPHGQ